MSNIGINPKRVLEHLLLKDRISQEQINDYSKAFLKLNSNYHYFLREKFEGDLQDALAYYILEQLQKPYRKYLTSIKNLPKLYAEALTPRGKHRAYINWKKDAIKEVMEFSIDIKIIFDQFNINPKKRLSDNIKHEVIRELGLIKFPYWYFRKYVIKRQIEKIHKQIREAKYELIEREYINRPTYDYSKLPRSIRKFLVNGLPIFEVSNNELTKQEIKLKNDFNFKQEFERVRNELNRKEEVRQEREYRKFLYREYNQENGRDSIARTLLMDMTDSNYAKGLYRLKDTDLDKLDYHKDFLGGQK